MKSNYHKYLLLLLFQFISIQNILKSEINLFDFKNNLIQKLPNKMVGLYIDEYLCSDCLNEYLNCIVKNKKIKVYLMLKNKSFRKHILERLKILKMDKKIVITYFSDDINISLYSTKFNELIDIKGFIYINYNNEIKIFEYFDIFDINGKVKDCEFKIFK